MRQVYGMRTFDSLWVYGSLFCLAIFLVLFTPCFSYPQNNQVDIVELKRKAEAGDIRAQYSLGWHYENGVGVRQNPAEAVRWYRKAAEQGDGRAQTNIGICYSKGFGVKNKTAAKGCNLSQIKGAQNRLAHLTES